MCSILYVNLNFKKLSNIVKNTGFKEMVKKEAKSRSLPDNACLT